jgi:hypothetical protein
MNVEFQRGKVLGLYVDLRFKTDGVGRPLKYKLTYTTITIHPCRNLIPHKQSKLTLYTLPLDYQPQSSSPGLQKPSPSPAPTSINSLFPFAPLSPSLSRVSTPTLELGLELTSTSIGVNFLSEVEVEGELDWRRFIAFGSGCC